MLDVAQVLYEYIDNCSKNVRIYAAYLILTVFIQLYVVRFGSFEPFERIVYLTDFPKVFIICCAYLFSFQVISFVFHNYAFYLVHYFLTRSLNDKNYQKDIFLTELEESAILKYNPCYYLVHPASLIIWLSFIYSDTLRLRWLFS
jgi:hypothetical protein